MSRDLQIGSWIKFPVSRSLFRNRILREKAFKYYWKILKMISPEVSITKKTEVILGRKWPREWRQFQRSRSRHDSVMTQTVTVFRRVKLSSLHWLCEKVLLSLLGSRTVEFPAVLMLRVSLVLEVLTWHYRVMLYKKATTCLNNHASCMRARIIESSSAVTMNATEQYFLVGLCIIFTRWFNPLSPSIHIQILQTDLYTFP